MKRFLALALLASLVGGDALAEAAVITNAAPRAVVVAPQAPAPQPAAVAPAPLARQTAVNAASSTDTYGARRRRRRAVVHKRSWKHSALIIGGATVAGAGLGHAIGGGKGGWVGALAGAGAGTVYDHKTRVKRQ